MAQEVPISMTILRNKIIEGITQIHKDINQNEAVLFIGDTGVGKSTLLSYLIGNQLKVQEVGLKPCLVNCNQVSKYEVKIGHQKYSQTSVPVRVKLQQIAIYDCPGFNDNKSRQAEIANSFYYQRLMSLYQKTKIVIVIDEGYITQSRALRLPELAQKLQTAFGTLDLVRYSTLLVVNKCSPDSTIQDVQKQLSKLIETPEMFTPNQVKFFQFLMKNDQVFSFKQPRRSQIGQKVSDQFRQSLLLKIKSLDYMDQIDIKNIISDVAKLAIRDHLDIIAEKSTNIVSTLMNKIKTAIFNSKTGLFQIKQQIVKLLEYKEYMQTNNDFGPLFEFCLQRKIRQQEFNSFKSDLQIVDFFTKIYSKKKTESYYMNVMSIILASLSIMLQKVDTMIQDQKLQVERKKRKQQMKKEQQKIKILQQQNKQNQQLNKKIENTKNQLKAIKKHVTILQPKQQENVNITLLPEKQESLVLAFQRKLLNAQLKIKQISYAVTQFHAKASFFSNSLNH